MEVVYLTANLQNRFFRNSLFTLCYQFAAMDGRKMPLHNPNKRNWHQCRKNKKYAQRV